MSTPNDAPDSPDSPEQEEQKLLALTSVGLDGREQPRYRAVDEFAPEFLLPLEAPQSRPVRERRHASCLTR